MSRDQLRRAFLDTDEWGHATASVPADREYESDLGAEMRRDAIRVVQDELSEMEFYRRYHDARIDDQPTQSEA